MLIIFLCLKSGLVILNEVADSVGRIEQTAYRAVVVECVDEKGDILAACRVTVQPS